MLRSLHSRLLWYLLIPIAAFCAAPRAIPYVAGQVAPRANAQTESAGRVRVAEGEYQIFRETDDGGVGPFALMVYNFHESWTLWKLPDGSFDVEGERNYESPMDAQQHSQFSVHLSSAFRVLGLKELRPLRWRSDSGPLTCDFLPAELVCSSNAKDPAQNIRLDLPMHSDYGFLWPISAFSLSGITRFPDTIAIESPCNC